jgi:hypothetical protein
MGGGVETLALIVGEGSKRSEGEASPLDVLARAAGDVLEYATPADALDGLRSRAGGLPPRGRMLIVIDGRGAFDARLPWIPLFVGLDLGPVILVVDDDRPEAAVAARKHGASRCLEHRHLARHPGLLARSARRALSAVPRPGNLARS